VSRADENGSLRVRDHGGGHAAQQRTTLQAIYMPAAQIDAPLAGQVHWDFGDGSHADTGYLSVGQDYGQTGQGPHGKPVLFIHSFRPGMYRVRASGKDTDGNPVSWTITVRCSRGSG
jgi:hypothetical protein